MPVDVDHVLKRWEDLKGLRLAHESRWQRIADYLAPGKDFSIARRPGDLRGRRVSSNVGPNAAKRMAALLLAYAVDYTRPFLKPNVESGLVASGRRLELDAPAMDWCEITEWSLFDKMMRPKSGFNAAMPGVLYETVLFGNGVLYTGRKRGFGPYYQARPLRSCWWAEDDEGTVDTLYYLFSLPLWRVLQKPEWAAVAATVDKWKAKADQPRRDLEQVLILHVVEPRDGGKSGAVAENKPYASAFVAIEPKVVLEESGFDQFPYGVARLDVEPGQLYGSGAGWAALPDVMVLNHLQAAVERGVELQMEPPLFMPARLFGGPLDRRPGATNSYDAAALGFQNAEDAVQALKTTGDPAIGVQYMAKLTENIELAFYVDWMRGLDTPGVTATAIMDKRDLRLRGMSSIVARIDRELMGPLAERTFAIELDEGRIPRPPPSLGGIDMEFDYVGPLAVQQLSGQAEILIRLLGAAQQVAQTDQIGAQTVIGEEVLRGLAEAWGAPMGVVAKREAIEQLRQAEAARQQQAQEMQNVTQAAGALRDGGQGAQSLVGAANDAGMGPGGDQGADPAAPGQAQAA